MNEPVFDIVIVSSSPVGILARFIFEKNNKKVACVKINSSLSSESHFINDKKAFIPYTLENENNLKWFENHFPTLISWTVGNKKTNPYKNGKQTELLDEEIKNSFLSDFYKSEKVIAITFSSQDKNDLIQNVMTTQTTPSLQIKEGEITSLTLDKNKKIYGKKFLLLDSFLDSSYPLFPHLPDLKKYKSSLKGTLCFYTNNHKGTLEANSWNILLDNKKRYEPILGNFIKKTSENYTSYWTAYTPFTLNTHTEDIGSWIHFIKKQVKKTFPQNSKDIENSKIFTKNITQKQKVTPLIKDIKNLEVILEDHCHYDDILDFISTLKKLTPSV